ncbi:MAG TPA: hypothetical protein VK034_24380 [Enhygromyxa sp.]|nr:hypothetical protein [Enhygromyxa sp.]
MAQLDERTLRDFARLRDRGAAPSAAKQRVFAALEVQLGGGGPDDGGGESGDPSPELLGDGGASSGLGYAAKVVGATLSLAAGGLLAIRVGVELARALAGPSAVADPPARAPVQPVPVIASPAEHEPIDPAPPKISEPENMSRPAPARPRPSDAAPPEPEPEPTDTLAAELALLEAAHAAADPSAALLVLERHLDRFPAGELADERELLRIENLCRLDRLADARELSDRFLLERPSSALRRRLASVCPALAEPQKN